MDKDANDRRLANDAANKRALSEELKSRDDESSRIEAERQDNEADGIDAERASSRGEDLGKDRS